MRIPFLKTPHLFILLTLLLTIFLSIYKLGDLPYSVHGDEGETAIQALDIAKGKASIIGVGWYDVPLFAFAPHAVTMIIFGENAFGNRLGAVLFSILTIPLFFLFVETHFTRRVALIATVLLVTSHMWIALSRLGLPYTQTTFFVISTLYFLTRGMKSGHTRDFILGGIFLGLCFYSYYPARIVPFILLPYILMYVIKAKDIKKTVMQCIVCLASVAIVFIPQGIFFLENPEAFSNRTNTVFIFSQTGRQWTNYNKSDSEILLEQTKKTLDIFKGDNSTQYGYKGQLIDFITLTFFFLGIVYALRFFSSTSIFLFVWLSLALLGQILTTMPTPIFLPRFVVGLPVFFIFCALGFEALYRIAKRYRLTFMLVLFLLLVIIYNLRIYFIEYPKQLDKGIAGGGFHELTPVKIASYVKSLPTTYETVFLTAPYLYADYGSLRFLLVDKKRMSLNPQSLRSQSVLGTTTELNNKQTVFIVYPEYKSALEELKTMYPRGEVITFHNGKGENEFFIYKVDNH